MEKLFQFLFLAVLTVLVKCEDKCSNCNTYVGVGAGLVTSFVTILIVASILVATLLLKRTKKRHYGPIATDAINS